VKGLSVLSFAVLEPVEIGEDFSEFLKVCWKSQKNKLLGHSLVTPLDFDW
jgi:hypothetical protein